MKARILLLFLVTGIISGATGQNTIDLTFTAVDNTAHVQLDSIRVMNRTQGGDTVLYWPDTVLTIFYVGIHENPGLTSDFKVFRNYPNPVTDHTTVPVYVPEKGKVSITVTDIAGRVILQSERVLDKGKHSFRFTPGNGSQSFFTARWQGQSSSIRIIHPGFHSGASGTLEYTGSADYSPGLKSIGDIQDFPFTPGDELLYIGYNNGFESGIPDSPEVNQTFTFQFATNIPCPAMPTVEYGGQVYNTIQVFSQCWLKENLNAGEMINGTIEQSDNGTIEKYCYDNDPDNCIIYGGLYQWDEMMQYTTQQGAQGICPPGWHVPTDEEWKVLEGAVDSLYGIGDPEWDISLDYRGYDAGTNLKTTSGWNANGNGTDLFGFSALPGGIRLIDGSILYAGIDGIWWSSAGVDDGLAWDRNISRYAPDVRRYNDIREYGFSVRCLRD